MASDELIDRLMSVAALAERLQRRVSARIGRTSASPSMRRAVLALFRTPHSTDRAIGHELAMASPQLSREIAALIQRGWVRSEPSPDDKRQRLLELTDGGRDAAKEILLVRQRAFDIEWGMLRPEEQAYLWNAINGPALQPAITGTFEIREFGPEDVPLLVQWLSTDVRKEWDWSSSYISYAAQTALLVQERNGTSLVAEMAGQTVGFCLAISGANRLEIQPDEANATITVLYVQDSQRRRGIGSSLLLKCYQGLSQQSYSSVYVQISERQIALARVLKAQSFHKHEGFERDGRFAEPGKWVTFSRRLNLLRQ